MKKITLAFLTLFLSLLSSVAQEKLQSPSQFLGYELGSKFTSHYQVGDYFKYLEKNSKNIKLQPYGKTNEARDLFIAIVASDENLGKLEEIRNSNFSLASLQTGVAMQKQPTIVWLSYNVHGNEAVSTEAAMQTIFELLNPTNLKTKEWLKNTIVIIDPCLNPDGRERYVNFYNPIATLIPDVKSYAREHQEPWPSGRANHYYFDLNRDWAWQTQTETQKRLALYNQWLPQIHVDFHEQGFNDPYYFAPAAEPFHAAITSWQREFQTIIGKNNAKYFDENGWLYFTKEQFDLLYPSYGDTYPIYNGSIGMTYEQGGIAAGLAVVTQSLDTLTLKQRIAHHYTTGLSTIETASAHAEKLNEEFKRFFSESKNKPSGNFKTYVVKADNNANLNKLAVLLKNNGIQIAYGGNVAAKGYNYFSGKTESFKVEPSDMLISAYQPKSVLLRVLMEPQTLVPDSNTYDITAWALPYAYGLKTYALTQKLVGKQVNPPAIAEKIENETKNAYAWIIEWKALNSVQFLSSILKKNVKVRYSELPFEAAGKKFDAGSLIITRNGNENLSEKLETILIFAAKESNISLTKVSSGMVQKGSDFGSTKIKYIKKNTVAVLSGDEVNSLNFGEVWHYFEQQIGYPLTIINTKDMGLVKWSDIDVLIAADGVYTNLNNDTIQNWIKSGGKLIAIRGAIDAFADKKGFVLKAKINTDSAINAKDIYRNIKAYGNRERSSISKNIPGAIFKLDLDNTHPLAFGYPNFYYSLKLDSRVYNFLENGWNVGTIRKQNYTTGFAGFKVKEKLKDGVLFGVEEIGRGCIIYLVDNPLFRSFWENGKLLFANAVFIVGR